jgi:hypothetical protein
MKNVAIITLVALGTSLARYAGINNPMSNEKSKTKCCEETKCCPTDLEMKNCCTNSCD